MLKRYTNEQLDELVLALEERTSTVSTDIVNTVRATLDAIRLGGDRSLRNMTKHFDGIDIECFVMTREEKERQLAKVSPELYAAMERAAANIKAFHEKQKTQSWVTAENGIVMGQRVLPLRRVGMYVPGGTAAYPSTVLMDAIPAKVAGVKELVICTPPKAEGVSPAVVAAAEIAGVDEILTIGGAQAIAALAYGTESIERVDKIVGPGNIYVATAKRLVYGSVDIDMIAGPSEVLVIADSRANPAYVAADLMSQAEHDPLAASVLITTDASFADEVETELNRQIAGLSRRDIIEKSLAANGACVIVPTIEEAVALSDRIAPEHLELAVRDPFAVLGLVHNAGSVFLGDNTPEPLGDYYAGPNHVLPTNGTARFASSLGTDSFVKRSSYLYYNDAALDAASDDVIRFAEAEGFTAHANSIKVRKEGTSL